jgi:hypothetical protein
LTGDHGYFPIRLDEGSDSTRSCRAPVARSAVALRFHESALLEVDGSDGDPADDAERRESGEQEV